MFDWLGWLATATFAGSYFCTKPSRLKQIQALAAVFWLSYGILIKAVPLIVANIIVASLALASSFRREGGEGEAGR